MDLHIYLGQAHEETLNKRTYSSSQNNVNVM